MVARRPDDDERRVRLVAGERVDRLEAAAAGPGGGGVGAGCDDGVGIEMTAAGPGELLERIEVAGIVHQLELGAGGVATGAGGERILELRVLDAGEDGADARRPLRMSPAGVVQIGSGRA